MTDKMREVWDAHDTARNKAWREEPGTFDTLDAFKAGATWQAAQSVPDAELERLRKDAAKVLHSEQIRIAAVAAVRAVTGCPDLKGKDGAYLVDEIIARLLEMQNDAAIAAEGEK